MNRGFRPVQIHKPGIILSGSVNSSGSKAGHQPQHTRVLIHVRKPLVGAVAVAHAGRARHIIPAEIRTGYPLHQYRHLFVLLRQPPLLPVLQGRKGHGTGIDGPHRLFKGFQPFLRIPLIHAEHRLVFPRESVAKAVLQKAGGPHDAGALTEIIQNLLKLFPNRQGKFPVQEALLQRLCLGKIALRGALAYPLLPAAVVDNIRIKHIRSYIIGIVRLAAGGKFGNLLFGNLSGQQHTAGLSADGAAADHAVPQQKVVRRPEIFPDHDFQPFISGHGAVDDLLLRLRAEISAYIFHLRHAEKAVLAVVVLILISRGRHLHHLIITAQLHAAVHRHELVPLQAAPVGQKHIFRMAVPDLQGPQVYMALRGVDVQKELGRIPDSGYGVKGMAPPYQRKIRHRVQLKEIRARNLKEISHHQIRIPGRLQL